MFHKFARRFAYEYMAAGAPGIGPRRFGKRWFGSGGFHTFEMRHGPGHFGKGFPFRFGGGHSSRFFGRGDVKFALLELLQERPMHGYEMMKALEEKSGGFYVPSAGTIYPTLQLLEDRGFVTTSEAEGKKIYHITEAGRSALAERRKEVEDSEDFAGMKGFGKGHHDRWHSAEMQSVKHEAKEVMRLLMIATRMAIHDPAELERLRGILKGLHHALAEMIYGGPPPKASPQTPKTETAPDETPSTD